MKQTDAERGKGDECKGRKVGFGSRLIGWKIVAKNRAIHSYSVPKLGYKFFVQLTFDVTDFFFGEADSKSIEGGEGGRRGTLGLSGRKTFYSSSMYLIFPPTQGKPLTPLN